MQVWNVLRAARRKCRTQKSPKIRHPGTIAQICLTISSQVRHVHVSTIGKMVKLQCLPTCPYNMVDFGPLAAEICWRSKFQRVSHLGSVTARHSSSGRQPNFASFNRGRHLHSAGRPSCWALAHISSFQFFFLEILHVWRTVMSWLCDELVMWWVDWQPKFIWRCDDVGGLKKTPDLSQVLVS